MKIVGKGRTATIRALDDSKVLKLFNPAFPKSSVIEEYNKNVYLNSLQLPMPRVYEWHQYDLQYGIIYERASDKTLLTLLLSQKMDTQKIGQMMAETHHQIHQQHGPELPGLKAEIKKLLPHLPVSSLEKARILTYLNDLKDDDIVCHFDFHPDNILYHDHAVVIDWANAFHGNAFADVCVSLIILTFAQVKDIPAPLMAVTRILQANLKQQYLQAYIVASGSSENSILAWWLPSLVFRYFYGSPEEKPALLAAIKAELAD